MLYYKYILDLQKRTVFVMQVKKDKTYNLILKIAKSEFITNGYKDTSMRIISKKSGIGLSNIYNYFKNKNELLVAVLNPLLAFINTLFELNNDTSFSLDVFSSKNYQSQNIQLMVSLVEKYRDELNLLLFHSYGSSLEKYRDEFSNKYMQDSIVYLSKLKENHPEINIKVSTFFIHTLGSWLIAILGEIVTHKELTHKEIEEFMTNYIAFGTGGWEKLIKG